MSEHTVAPTGCESAQVFKKLCCLIHVIPGIDAEIELTNQTLLADLALDSLRLVEIIFELERQFEIEADEGLMAEARTLGDVVRLFVGECVSND